VHITRLKVQNWLNFTRFDIALERRNFFVGPNAAGKSNLLEVIKFLRDIVSDGGLQAAVERRGGVGELRCLSARSNPNILIEIAIGTDETPNTWTYALEFTSHKNSGPLVVREEIGSSEQSELILKRPESEDKADEFRLSQTALEQVSLNRPYREIVDFLRSVQYLHVVPQMIRDPERQHRKHDPFGSDLIERIASTSPRSRNARLSRMEEALKIAAPQLQQLELKIDKKGIPHLRGKYAHWRPQGAWQREDKFSDGTLRLLGLIWSLQERGGPLLLEEPELSLNSAVVRHLAPLISRAMRRSDRQVLIATHSADLLSNSVRLEEVHLLRVGREGTEVVSGVDLADVKLEIDAGIPLAEALLPKSAAANADQLSLLDLLGA
jgi:predicted ATPase